MFPAPRGVKHHGGSEFQGPPCPEDLELRLIGLGNGGGGSSGCKVVSWLCMFSSFVSIYSFFFFFNKGFSRGLWVF